MIILEFKFVAFGYVYIFVSMALYMVAYVISVLLIESFFFQLVYLLKSTQDFFNFRNTYDYGVKLVSFSQSEGNFSVKLMFSVFAIFGTDTKP